MSADNLPLIDLRIGEARSIRDITCSLYDLERSAFDIAPQDWEYQVKGYAPLVKLLEFRHNAHVIITNGAIQALQAACHALQIKGYRNVGIRIPYWNRIPEIIKRSGLNCSPFHGSVMSGEDQKIDSYLLTMPNNPDGFMPSWDTVRSASEIMHEHGIPLIHDAVYYNRSYLPLDHPTESVGDVQIFSASKTYGLSALRVGYLVIYNASFYRALLDYMEYSTMGVSVLAQKQLFHILKREEQLPFLQETFIKQTREAIKRARQTIKELDPNKVSVPSHSEYSCGVFAWLKPVVKNIFEQANVAVLDGDIFGAPGYIRVNLAAGQDRITEMVKRINSI